MEKPAKFDWNERNDLNDMPQEEADFEEKIRQFFASPTIVPHDHVIDDSAIPKKPNFFRFCTDADGLNVEPYPMQVIVASRLYNDICPHCSNNKYLLNPKVSDPDYRHIRKNLVFYEHGVCPNCGSTRAKDLNAGLLNPWNQLAAAVGQRSGKSALASFIYCYHLHWLLKLQNPAKVYGLPPSQVLQASIVAVSMAQAVETLWMPVFNLLTDAPWHKAYHALLKQHQDKTGEEAYRLNDTFVVYKHRRLEIRPQSPSVKTLRGRTRYQGGIDEIAYLDLNIEESGNKVKMNAKGVNGAIDRSLLTVRNAATRLTKQGYPDIPTGINISISSIADMRDMIMFLYNRSLHSKTILGYKAATWEFNPNIHRDDPEMVEAFEADPVAAARDFGSVPPVAINAFFSRFSRIEPCFSGKRNGILYHYIRKRQADSSYIRGIKIDRIRAGWRPSVLAFDGGYTNNSFAFACGSITDDGQYSIDLIGEVIPRTDVPVSFRSVLDDAFSVIFEKRNVQLVVSDRWQNIKMMQDIQEDYGITTQAHRLTYGEMVATRERMWDGQVILPNLDISPEDVLTRSEEDYPHCFDGDPMAHLVLQLQTIRDTGADVVKGTKLTDDLWRCISLCITYLADADVQAEFLSGDEDYEDDLTPSEMFLGTTTRLSGTSSGPRKIGGGGSREVKDTQGSLIGYSSHYK